MQNNDGKLHSDTLLTALRAVGDSTRLRILIILSHGELTVSELTRVLDQSQPRVSRHLKCLAAAGLVVRHREGTWVLYRLADRAVMGEIVRSLVGWVETDDDIVRRDEGRLSAVRHDRAVQAAAYFRSNAAAWDRVRALHVSEASVEEAMLEMASQAHFDVMVDLGTGTGRMLETFAGRIKQGIGFDVSHEMLFFARTNLERADLGHCQVRHGDIYNVPLADNVADLVVMHQVLHYLDNPAGAVREAGRLLRPKKGRLVVADYAPHDLEFLRQEHAHRRLGFRAEEVAAWMREAGFGLIEMRSLSDNNGENPLKVVIWASKRQGRAVRVPRAYHEGVHKVEINNYG
ncbi:MAG: metalloregulator ArsR/SmtB family transcription factor [Parvularculales bacterium]